MMHLRLMVGLGLCALMLAPGTPSVAVAEASVPTTALPPATSFEWMVQEAFESYRATLPAEQLVLETEREAQFAARAYQSFSDLARSSAFVDLYANAPHATVLFTTEHGDDGLHALYVGVNWHTDAETHSTFWTMDPVDFHLSGPADQVSGLDVDATGNTRNWAGYSYQSKIGGVAQQMKQASFDFHVPTISLDPTSPAPQNLPSGYVLHDSMSIWSGVSIGHLGTSIMQVGLARDATDPVNHGDYSLWYEYTATTSRIYYPNNPKARIGDSLNPLVQKQTDGNYLLRDYALTQHVGYDAWITPQAGYTPMWAEIVLEAPSLAGKIQRLAQTSPTTTQFCDIHMYDINGNGYTASDPYFENWNLHQVSSSSVISESVGGFNSGTCGYWVEPGYFTTTWIRSDYDWLYVNP